jgi:hypothetical protein
MSMLNNLYFSFAGLESHLSDEQQLLNSLKHTVVQRRDDPVSNSCTYAGESLITLLLKVDLVQPPLIRILFEKMPEFFDRDIDGYRTEDNIPKLIIHRLRWLDNLNKESDLTNKLIDMLEIAPLSLKREVVSALPDIVNDSEHQQLLPALQGILDSDPECTNAVITAPADPALDSLPLLRSAAVPPAARTQNPTSAFANTTRLPWRGDRCNRVRTGARHSRQPLRRACVPGRHDRQGKHPHPSPWPPNQHESTSFLPPLRPFLPPPPPSSHLS